MRRRSDRSDPSEAERRDAGFTLSELLVVMTLTGIIGGAVLAVCTTGLHHETTLQDRKDALGTAREVIQRTDRDIRAADPLLLARGDEIVMRETEPTVTRTMTYSVVPSGTGRWQLDVDESDVTPSGAAMPAVPTTVLATNLVGVDSAPVFSVTPVAGYVTTDPLVDPTTCAEIGSTPTAYATDCVGVITVTISVQPPSLTSAVTTTDNGTELRNVAS